MANGGLYRYCGRELLFSWAKRGGCPGYIIGCLACERSGLAGRHVIWPVPEGFVQEREGCLLALGGDSKMQEVESRMHSRWRRRPRFSVKILRFWRDVGIGLVGFEVECVDALRGTVLDPGRRENKASNLRHGGRGGHDGFVGAGDDVRFTVQAGRREQIGGYDRGDGTDPLQVRRVQGARAR